MNVRVVTSVRGRRPPGSTRPEKGPRPVQRRRMSTEGFASSQYNLGSAIGVVMLLILLAVTLVYLRLLRRQGEER